MVKEGACSSLIRKTLGRYTMRTKIIMLKHLVLLPQGYSGCQICDEYNVVSLIDLTIRTKGFDRCNVGLFW